MYNNADYNTTRSFPFCDDAPSTDAFLIFCMKCSLFQEYQIAKRTAQCMYDDDIFYWPSSTMLPFRSLCFRFQPVENSWPMSNRGKGCASVLMTTLSSGRRSLGEKSR